MGRRGKVGRLAKAKGDGERQQGDTVRNGERGVESFEYYRRLISS